MIFWSVVSGSYWNGSSVPVKFIYFRSHTHIHTHTHTHTHTNTHIILDSSTQYIWWALLCLSVEGETMDDLGEGQNNLDGLGGAAAGGHKIPHLNLNPNHNNNSVFPADKNVMM